MPKNFGSFVEMVDNRGSRPTVTLITGMILTADLVIGADGVRLKMLASVLGSSNVETVASAMYAYRATVPARKMRENPTTGAFLDDANTDCWIGHQRHIMACRIRGGEMYSLVMSHLDSAPVSKWNEPGGP